MEISLIICIILWTIMSFSVLAQYAPYCKELSFGKQIIVCLIFFFGGPILILSSVLETILNYFLPEGWGDDDDFKGY